MALENCSKCKGRGTYYEFGATEKSKCDKCGGCGCL